jgi:RimJ/RimL family protein N-acetyltransferase
VRTPAPTTLRGRLVVLEPLEARHAADLFAAFAEGRDVWRWLPFAPPASTDELEAAIGAQLVMQAQGAVVAFAQTEPATGRAVGVTTYLNIAVRDGGIEIGGTWIGRRWQRTGLNTEAKLLLMTHAFEELDAVRVQLKTDGRNVQSQTAIARLGAVREGVLRKHMRLWDGFVRDTVMYSVLADEWPAVKARLEGLLRR